MKRQRIIDAAIQVFSRQGFYNATVADVASVADVADGTIYLYFKSKDDLLISIFEHSMEVFIGAAHEELALAGDAREKLKKFIALHLKLVQKNQDLAQVIQIELRQSSKFMKEYANEKFFDYLGIVEAILKEGQSAGIFRAEADPVILKRAIFGAVDEMALEWVLMKKKRYTMEEAAEQLGGMFIEGLVKA
ncbi:MAG: TetR/AcrR family transcriptional regulator [Deltaproteobacteria bacterium]|nr:TetR/AcrR family transcriptional regulator [Deltaproteobacteria bacterium]